MIKPPGHDGWERARCEQQTARPYENIKLLYNDPPRDYDRVLSYCSTAGTVPPASQPQTQTVRFKQKSRDRGSAHVTSQRGRVKYHK